MTDFGGEVSRYRQLREAGMQKWLARREITDALDKKGWNATEYKILRDAFEQVDNELGENEK